jgi:hypothetical protein
MRYHASHYLSLMRMKRQVKALVVSSQAPHTLSLMSPLIAQWVCTMGLHTSGHRPEAGALSPSLRLIALAKGWGALPVTHTDCTGWRLVRTPRQSY